MHKLYSKYASPQKATIDERIPQILDLIENIPMYPDVPFVLGDFGAADGGNSLLLLDKIIGHLKGKQGDDYEILIILEDQPDNDYNSLFNILHENFDDMPGYREKYKNVYFTATADNFFKQCVPRNTLHLAVSFTSLHWIPRSCIPSDCFLKELIPEESDTVRDLAAKCWYDFLFRRSEELKPGGYAFLSIPCDPERELSDTTVQGYTYLPILEKMWFSLFEEGTITKEEHDKMVLPLYLRTEKELRLPFDDTHDARLHRSLNLELVSLDIGKLTYSFYDRRRMQVENGELTIKDVVREYADFLKAFTFGVFLSSLSTLREKDENLSILNRLYELICDFCFHHPEKCVCVHILANLVVRKVDKDRKHV